MLNTYCVNVWLSLSSFCCTVCHLLIVEIKTVFVSVGGTGFEDQNRFKYGIGVVMAEF